MICFGLHKEKLKARFSSKLGLTKKGTFNLSFSVKYLLTDIRFIRKFCYDYDYQYLVSG